MTAEPLPELVQQWIDHETLDCLVRDLEAMATILEVRGKSGLNCHAQRENLNLNEGVELLKSNQLRGVQIRYQFENQVWLDTLLATPQGIQLTRMRL